HEVRFIGRLVISADSIIARKLSLASAWHSRLGDVGGMLSPTGNVSTSLQHGDTLTLTFDEASVDSGMVRELFLLSQGVYTSNLPASTRPAVSAAPTQ